MLNEGQRCHFLTQRFDRRGNRKHHVQTLNGLAHTSYKQLGLFSYEEVFSVRRQLGAPAYDIAYSYKPGSRWVNTHAMTLNGKRDGFTRDDFYAFSQVSRLFSKARVDAVIDHTRDVMAGWRTRAQAEDVPATLIELVGKNLRLGL